MQNRKIILFNGPPQSGKDTAVNSLVECNAIDENLKFAKEVKERTHALYGLYDDEGKVLKHDHFELVKDLPRVEFRGLKPRDAYINTSEKLMKPVHGNGVWAEFLAEHIVNDNENSILGISDLGFNVELKHFIKMFGVENIMLFRIFRDGYNFNNDSRKYVTVKNSDGSPMYSGLVYHDVINEDLNNFLDNIYMNVKVFLDTKENLNIGSNA